ncbi:RpiB/LacA/LacB family sugar-phosphate isomerase [Streptomyces sp. LE64]|uniref:RpiB/LacA/LacB family sugar-phosphate isomerase n=1 Tax=Streptomyces sp. LE64 TaxID=3448653 RepID=UPI00404233D7
MPAGLRVAIGSDRAGAAYHPTLADQLRRHPRVRQIVGIGTADFPRAYPEVGFAAAQLIDAGLVDRALLMCHTGLGMAITANKVFGVRAVTAHDPLSVEHAVTHNNAQVLCLGVGVIGAALARQLTEEWLTHTYDPACRAAAKLSLIAEFEHRRQPDSG